MGLATCGKGGTKGNKGTGDDAARDEASGKGRTTWRRPQRLLDDDGYELVQPRKVPTDKGKGKKGEETAPMAKGSRSSATDAAEARRRWSDVDDSDDDVVDDDELDDGHDEGDAGEGGAVETDPWQLRRAYEEHARAARDLERRGIHGPPLATLQAARDEAEQRWREAKPPAPLSKRLEWAETKLRKAQSTLSRLRMDLDAFDEETERKREELCRRIQEAQGWYDWRRQQLDGIHEEAAEAAPGRRDAGRGSAGADDVRKRIRGHMLPEMQAILEAVPEGSDLHGRLALFAAGLADAEARLGAPREAEGPECYHMADDGSRHEDWDEDEDYQGMEEEQGDQDDGPVDRKHDATRTSEWKPEGPGRWTRTGASRGGNGHQGTRATATATVRTQAHDSAAGSATDDTKATNSTAANAAGGAAGGDVDKGGDDGTRAGKHRRRQTEAEAADEEREASDHRRAQELQRQLEWASAAQEQSYNSGLGGFGSEAALSTAAQGFVLQVQRVQAQANEMGVEPTAQDGRTLLQLSPAELRQWAHENLGGDW